MTHERAYERERPRTSDEVVQPPTPGRSSASAALDGPTSPIASGIVMRKGTGDIDANAEAAVAAASGGGGEALPAGVRDTFEASLGTDLSSVRIHTDPTSQAAAAAVSARAYTIGDDIHFGAAQYEPGSEAGRHLLAHEIAHTVQQRGGSPVRQHKLEVSAPGDALELEADRAADDPARRDRRR